MFKFFIYLIIIIPTLIAGVLVTVYSFQEHLIFYPDKLSKAHKFSFPIEFDEINIEVEKNIFINALHFKAENAKGIIYYHHGNAGNMQNWGNAALNLVALGFDVFMYDFRGYGKSNGEINHEKVLHHDAVFIYKYILNFFKEEQIILFGA